ncbi:flagellar L-ring protein [Striga asiatica]|uniref:Flagellar L-ring protein n=1 Tax=Striga asiatica TaxID=4170 RepID=A0A5A7RD87_STRAF|nr:flagellar L-ring protein [Striga asiatica]
MKVQSKTTFLENSRLVAIWLREDSVRSTDIPGDGRQVPGCCPVTGRGKTGCSRLSARDRPASLLARAPKDCCVGLSGFHKGMYLGGDCPRVMFLLGIVADDCPRVMFLLGIVANKKIQLDECGTFGSGGIVYGREQVLAAVGAMGIVPRIARVGPFPVNSRAGSCGFQRGLGGALIVAIPEGIGGGAREKPTQAHDYSVEAHVVVGRHQWWALWAVIGLVERPAAVPGALGLRVAHPYVGELGITLGAGDSAGTVGPAAVEAEAVDGDNDIDGVRVVTPGCQLDDVFVGEGLTEGVVFVKDLPAEAEGERVGSSGEVVVLLHRLPPRADGLLVSGRSRDGDEIDGDFAAEEGALVVAEELLLWISGTTCDCSGSGGGEAQ